MTPRDDLRALAEQMEFALAQLRHAYGNLKQSGATMWNQRQRMMFADGLIAPQIEKFERIHRALAAAQETPQTLNVQSAIDNPTMADAAEMLWVVLANVSGGDWKQQSEEWQEAAARWRDYYFKALTSHNLQAHETPTPRPAEAIDSLLAVGHALADLAANANGLKCERLADQWQACCAKLFDAEVAERTPAPPATNPWVYCRQCSTWGNWATCVQCGLPAAPGATHP